MARLMSICLSLLVCAGSGGAAPKEITGLKPTVILVSIDGFRYDYLDKYRATNLSRLARQGVRAKWMIPVFPASTFPNHYSIATGLYVENHGIVGNSMFDPEHARTFGLGKREEVENGRWWGGEPIWVTAEKQGQKAGTFFFPGTEAEIAGKRPSYYKRYEKQVPNAERVDTVLSWLDLPPDQRPTFLTLYFSDVDDAGHSHGPESPEVARAVTSVDEAIGRLVGGLEKRHALEKVNLIVVSDHGMAPFKRTHVVFLDDYFDGNKAAHVVWSAEVVNIFPKAGEEEAIYRSLKARPIEHARLYRKSEIPARFRYQNHRRVAPIVVMADEGWRLTSRLLFEAEKARLPAGALERTYGAHGYDNQLRSMQAIFLGHGPAFKRGTVVEPFENVHVYHIMTTILGLTPSKNDGTFEAARQVLR